MNRDRNVAMNRNRSSNWDRTADVLVVGSGAAGYAAAVSAASAGRQVLMLEKAAESGGTTRRSGAAAWVPNNSLMRANKISDPREMALKYMAKLAHPTLYDPDHPRLGLTANDYSLIAAFYDNGARAIDALVAAGALGIVHDLDVPDYSADLPENRAPFGRLFNPKAVLDPAADHGTGPDMIAQLHAGAQRLGVELLLGHEVRGCVRSARGEVVGVEVDHPNGSLRVGARRGVVFASGGFLHNTQMCRDFLRGPIFGGCAVPTNTGDFVRIGMDLGADLGNMNQAWWTEVVLDQVLESPTTQLETIWMPGGDAMVLVNRHGRRVVNEKMTYNERGQAHFHWDASAREYPNLLLLCVFDDEVVRNPIAYRDDSTRQPVPKPGDKAPWVITGSNWDELAANVRQRLEAFRRYTGGYQLDDEFVPNLKETIARFNGFAEIGEDLDFHRGATPIQVFWGGPRRLGNNKNSTMFPFRHEGPYHAVILGGGAIDTKGGPKTDSMGRVLDRSGHPIPGLYGAGNCVAAPAGQAYWGAGGTIGLALVFGYLAGEAAAARSEAPLAIDSRALGR